MSLWGLLILDNWILLLVNSQEKITEVIKTNIKIVAKSEVFAKFNRWPSKKFMGIFIGFVDGDGYIDVGPQAQSSKKTKKPAKSTIRMRLVISLHKRDLILLEYFVKILGVGKVVTEAVGENKIRLILYKRDIISVILPLMKMYNLSFLTYQRAEQFAKLNFILDNSIVHWEDFISRGFIFNFKKLSVAQLLKLDFYPDWLVGFTMAEGSFGMKNNGSAFYQLRQTGEENVNLLKAAYSLITGKDEKEKILNPDSVNSYQLSLGSKIDIRSVLDFFLSSNVHPLVGYKLVQFNIWIEKLKISKRYSCIF